VVKACCGYTGHPLQSAHPTSPLVSMDLVMEGHPFATSRLAVCRVGNLLHNRRGFLGLPVLEFVFGVSAPSALAQAAANYGR